ncbi:MAG: PH domain-containing protein, partial [Chloroflexota bacterium]|nr:PH domain-containing protein [Chloroflexota bacterium]
ITLLWLTTCTLLRYSPWIDVLLGLALVGILTWAIWRTLNWWNDLYVLTDERVVDVEKVPIIREERREARLDRIQDVRYDQPTIIYRIFDFGHVWLETAGGIGRFTFDYIPQPRMVQAEIFRRLEAFRQRAEQRQREALLELLERYHQSIRG